MDEATLHSRLRQRAQRSDANAPFAISEAQLAIFAAGFEVPSGEGEVVLEWRVDPA